MKYRLQDLIDLEQFQSLMDRLNEIYPFPSAVIDNEGVILVATAWQDICTKFHRQNKECEKECIKSDQYILEHLAEANPAVSYRCPHGLIDNAMPIIVDGQHLGSFFTGQFFLEQPDLEFFREQAGKYGFDEDAYLEAVKKVPIWSLEQLDSYLFFIKEMIGVLSSVGLKNLKSIEVAEALRKSEESLSTTLDSIGDAVIAVDVEGFVTRMNPVAETLTGWTYAEALGLPLDQVLQIVNAATRAKVENPVEKVLREGVTVGLANHTVLIARDGTERQIADSTAPIRDGDGAINGVILIFRDVTEAQELDRQLREREKELNESQRIAHLGSWRLNLASNEVVWSEELYRMYGFDPTLPPPLYTESQKLFTPESWAKLSASIQKTVVTGIPYALELEIVREDGISGWMGACGEAVLNANGVIVGLRGVTQDITDSKQAERQLLLARTSVESASDSLYWIRPDGSIANVNKAACRLLGYNRSELLQLSVPDVDANYNAEVWQQHFPELKKHGSLTFESVQCAKDGCLIPVEIVANYVQCGNEEYNCAFVRDITARKRAEKALTQSSALLEATGKMAKVGGWEFDIESQRLLWTNEVHRIHEVAEDFQPTLAAGIDFYAPESKPVIAEAMQRAIELGEPFDLQLRIITARGTWRWVHTIGHALEQDGRIVKVLGTFQDITDRKRAEEALHDSEQRLRSYFNSPVIGIAITSLEKGWLETNPRLCAMLGYSMEELQGGMTWAELTHPDDLAADVAQFERLLAGEIDDYSMDKRFVRKSGEIIWTRLGVGCVRTSDGFVDYTVATLEDITERKQAEAERERLMAAIEQVAETIIITDAEGAIQYVNPFFEQVTGYTCKEAIGQNPRILKSGKHDDAFYKEMWDTLTRGEVWAGQIVNKKKDGTLFTDEMTISPVLDASGETVNYVAVNRDITHEIALTAQLRQAQKMEAVGQLAGGIAHDFNNMLQAIFGYGEMALQDAGTESPVRASVEEILKAGERATTLVGQLLAFSRRQVLELKDVNLNDAIAEVLKMLQRVIGEHVTLEAIRCEDLGIVRADPGQIDQILMNLCVNARDAMGEDGKITIETQNVQIGEELCEVHTWAKPGRYVLLSVTDTGCGMDQETLGKVFEPFFTTKDVGKGTGLGLATVYGLVNQHHGFIHVYSEVGKGTTFKIYLPLAGPSAAVVAEKSDGPVPTGTETILVAEDNDMLLKLTKHFLEFAGYTVLTAVDGEEALRVFEEHGDHIDLGLLDVMMPKLSGRAVYERVRETRPDMPFLFASGYSMNALHTNFVLDEGLQLVQKPFRREDLLRKVREVLDKGSAAPDEN
jgi:PAS domain S-box-containing protein